MTELRNSTLFARLFLNSDMRTKIRRTFHYNNYFHELTILYWILIRTYWGYTHPLERIKQQVNQKNEGRSAFCGTLTVEE